MAGALKHSSTYQKLWREGFAEGFAKGFAQGFAEGRVEGARAILLRVGSRRFGPPAPAARALIGQLHDPMQLTELCGQAIEATSWDDLGLGGSEP